MQCVLVCMVFRLFVLTYRFYSSSNGLFSINISMALNRLCTSIRHMIIRGQSNIIGRYCSSHVIKEQNQILPLYNSNNVTDITRITFIPRSLNIDFGISDNILKKNIIETPFKNIPAIEDPLKHNTNCYDSPLEDKSLQLPPTENVEKLAVNLIIIRRKKMQKHKRRKLRKKMQYVWAKIRHRRNVTKEKVFQAEMVAKITKAEAFDAKTYVNERLALQQKEFIPRMYRGEVLPRPMIKQFLDEKIAKREKRHNKFRLKLD